MEKKIRCPKCSKIFTCDGNPGEEIFIKCSNCGTEGKIILEKIEPIASKSLVVIDNTSKKYKDVLAVDNISFNIKQGEVFGYIGPNGAGKTTTIKIFTSMVTKCLSKRKMLIDLLVICLKMLEFNNGEQ